ncbi:MAG: hypothetical protein WC718_08025 [Phycisphaerales bacterium]|jgi:hypothetical protein
MPLVDVVLTEFNSLLPAASIVGDTICYTLTIDGEAVPQVELDIVVPDNRRFVLSPPVQRSVDVAGRSSFRVRVQVDLVHGLTSRRSIGWIERVIQWPFFEGEYRDANSNWGVTWLIDRLGEGIREDDPTDRLAFARDSAEGTILNTVGAPPAPMRVEIHPVLPVPALQQPPEQVYTPGSGRARYWSMGVYDSDLPGDPRIIQNPPVVPIVSAAQRSFAGDASTIRVTYMRPRTLLPADLVWSQRSLAGNARVEFVGGNTGPHVRVRGVATGEVGLELRYRGAMVAPYRLLVRPLKVIPCRVQLCHAGTPSTTPASTPTEILAHINIANRFLIQLGLILQMDQDTSVTDNAVPTGTPGVFRLQLPAPEVVNAPSTTASCTLKNSRPFVFNFAYIINDADSNLGYTTDWEGPSATQVEDSGTPSSSFIAPSGIPPHEAARTNIMRLFTPATQQRRPGLFAMYVTQNNATAMDFGGTIAHEFGHALGLRHRVNAHGGGSDDRLMYPPRENLMHGNATTYEAQDFDLLQARAVALSPLFSHH